MDNFSNLMMIGECLLDEPRTQTLIKSLQETVKPGQVVLDCGTGSGILAITAAKLGASKVYAIEINPGVAEITKNNIKINKLDHIIEVLCRDALEVELPTVDVLIMEMMDTGLIAEQQIPVANAFLQKGIISENTVVIPKIFETYIEFINYDFDFYGNEMPFIIQARNDGVAKRIKGVLSERILIDKLDLTQKNTLERHQKLATIANTNDTINAFVMTSLTTLTDNIKTWGTSDMNMPIVIPVQPRKVKLSESLQFDIRFKLAHGYDTIEFKWI